jgi:2-polyprenyl-6-hydroxyphenyl methylase/3-demethylubiquinone-9 3-methyltransferase
MKKTTFDPAWPESWRAAHPYDEMEMHGSRACKGYSCAYSMRWKNTMELIQDVTPAGGRVLDIAAAQGNFSLSLAEKGYDVTWNDLRDELAGYVKLKWESGRIEFAPGNVFDLGLGADFDTVLIAEVIEHTAHPDDFLMKTAKFVKPGGHVVLTTPNGGYFLNRLPKYSSCRNPEQFEPQQFRPNSDGHIFLLHEDEIELLAAKAGLKIRDVRLFTNPLTAGHLKSELLLKFLPGVIIAAFEKATGASPGILRRKVCTGMAVLLQKPQ